MTVKVPIAVVGNLTDEPTTGATDDGRDWARFKVAVNDRVLDPATNDWHDGETIFHDVTAFGSTARNVVASLHKGDRAVVTGDLQFKTWETDDGKRRQGSQIVADEVGPSLRFTTAEVAHRAPKVSSPDVTATGPSAAVPNWATAQPATAGASID